MPDEVYELLARGARYWFLLLMALIVWRSMSWYLRDDRNYKKRLRFLPDAGSVGRMVILHGGELGQIGTSFPVPREGTIGSSRNNDIRIKGEGIGRHHLRFRFEDKVGLIVESAGGGLNANVDGYSVLDQPVCMLHESVLNICGVEVQLLLFEGFECYGYPEEEAEPEQDAPMPDTVPAAEPMIREEPPQAAVSLYAPKRRRRRSE